MADSGLATPTMHRCLRVPELLTHIFQMIQAEPGGCATIAVLARTAKCFHDAALDTLWQTQASLVPLVKCLPEDSLTETREDDGTRKLVRLRCWPWFDFNAVAEGLYFHFRHGRRA